MIVRAGLVALIGVSLSSCNTLRDVQSAPQNAAGANLGSRVVVRDAAGVVPPSEERRVLQSIGAEGDGEALLHHLTLLAQVGEVGLYRGNTARLLVDGPATFKAMNHEIRRAKRRILLESYIFEDDGLATEMASLLAEKARTGVAVYVLYDSVGSRGTDAAFFDGLRKQGVSVCAFNPINPTERPGYFSIEHRNHRKVLVVDAEAAFAGGINISQVYAQGSFGSNRKGAMTDSRRGGWRDTQIELHGPAVAALAEQFVQTWQSQGCTNAIPEAPRPAIAQPGRRVVKVIISSPDDPYNAIYGSLIAVFKGSRESIKVTMAYFAPGQETIDVLCDAARRGVDVQLILPAKSDFSLILHAGRSYYSQLLKAGVRIFEMETSVLHSKTAVVDSVVGTVGSSNMDWRSFAANNEVNVIVLGKDFGTEMESLFERDLRASREITLDEWRSRGLWSRTMEVLGRAAERWL